MPNTVRIKRRAVGGAAGAPASLANAELAFNEQDDVLYYGKGTGGAGGTATSVLAIGGPGFAVSLSGSYANPVWITSLAASKLTGTVADGSIASALTGKTYNALSLTADTTGFSVAGGTTSKTLTVSNSITLAGTDASTLNIGTGGTLGTAAFATIANYAPLASPALSGTPTTPTAAVDTSTTQIASTAYVLGQASAVAGTALGVAAVGTSLRYARADHVHAMPTLSQVGAPTAAVSLNSQRITSLADPTSAQDAATKSYVDSVAQGLDVKTSVLTATTANIALTGLQTIDGISVVANDRVLVKNQTAPAENGVYLAQSGAWTRASDMDVWGEFVSAFFFVETGTQQADSGWVCTADPGGTLGTSAIAFTQFSGSGSYQAGAGLTLTGNILAVGAGTGITVNADDVALTGQALALHNLATNGLITRTGAGAVAARSIATSGTGISVSNGDAVAGNPTLSLATALSTFGGLTPAADQLPYYTGAAAAALTTLSSFGRSLIDDADAATARTTLGLSSMATQASTSVSITGGSITNLTTFDGITIDGGTF